MATENDIKQLMMSIIFSLNNIDTEVNIPNTKGYSLLSSWEERDEISGQPKDRFLVIEDGIEYWVTILLLFEGDIVESFSPCGLDINNNFVDIISEFAPSIEF